MVMNLGPIVGWSILGAILLFLHVGANIMQEEHEKAKKEDKKTKKDAI